MGQNRIDKTNAARLLERAGIRYELIPYRVGKEHLSVSYTHLTLPTKLEV